MWPPCCHRRMPPAREFAERALLRIDLAACKRVDEECGAFLYGLMGTMPASSAPLSIARQVRRDHHWGFLVVTVARRKPRKVHAASFAPHRPRPPRKRVDVKRVSLSTPPQNNDSNRSGRPPRRTFQRRPIPNRLFAVGYSGVAIRVCLAAPALEDLGDAGAAFSLQGSEVLPLADGGEAVR
jgi:hypothetical protein